MSSSLKEKDLEKRIKAAKKGLQNKQESTASTFASSKFNLLIDLFAGIAVGALLGYLLDNYLGTLPLFLFVCSILGCGGGFYNSYKDCTKQLNLKKDKRKNA